MLNTIEIFPWNHNFETGLAEIDAHPIIHAAIPRQIGVARRCEIGLRTQDDAVIDDLQRIGGELSDHKGINRQGGGLTAAALNWPIREQPVPRVLAARPA